MSNFSNISDVTTSVAPLSPPTTLTVAVCNDVVGNDLDTVLTIANPSKALGQVLVVGSECSTQSEVGPIVGDHQSTPHLKEVSATGDSQFQRMEQAQRVVKGAIQLAKDSGDPGAIFADDVLSAFSRLKRFDQANFQRAKSEIKKLKFGVSWTDLERAIRVLPNTELEVKPTHNCYARDIHRHLTVDVHVPIRHEGELYSVDAPSSLWVPYAHTKLVQLVTELHDGKDLCKKGGDYNSIANLVVSVAADSNFGSAPIGLACGDEFFQANGDTFSKMPLTPAHKQRFRVSFTPRKMDMPRFKQFLRETFSSNDTEEEVQQLALMQEIAGAVMFGLTASQQKAVLFHDPFGRSGKGTMGTILEQLVPETYRESIDPFRWDEEYYLAKLAGVRLNMVGELSMGRTIPAAVFKRVTGLDSLTGRAIAKMPFTFKNEATHIFMSNHMITTNDHTAAFYERWIVVVFPNSRVKLGLGMDPNLAKRILENELPGIAQWALEGAERLLKNGKFSYSKAHDHYMQKWRMSANPVEEFIHEVCDLVPQDQFLRRAALRDAYEAWRIVNHRKAYSPREFKEMVEHNIPLGITHATLHGIEIFRGVKFKPTEAEVAAQMVTDSRF